MYVREARSHEQSLALMKRSIVVVILKNIGPVSSESPLRRGAAAARSEEQGRRGAEAAGPKASSGGAASKSDRPKAPASSAAPCGGGKAEAPTAAAAKTSRPPPLAPAGLRVYTCRTRRPSRRPKEALFHFAVPRVRHALAGVLVECTKRPTVRIIDDSSTSGSEHRGDGTGVTIRRVSSIPAGGSRRAASPASGGDSVCSRTSTRFSSSTVTSVS